MKIGLTDKQRAFVDEYLVDLCATKAAVRAGYSKKTAKDIGCQNLAKPNIQIALTRALNERAKRTEVSQDLVVAELGYTGFFDIRKIFTSSGNLIAPDQLPDDVARAIKSIEVVCRPTGEIDEGGDKVVEYVHKYVFHDKIRALELLGKHIGMFSPITRKVGNVTISLNYGNGIVKRIENGIVKEIRDDVTDSG